MLCINQNIFFSLQINDPSPLLWKPPFEPHPKIVVLEIVERQPGATVGDGCPQMDQEEDAVTEDCDRLNHRHEREEYSRMVDSDEERDREREERDDDCSNSSEEDQHTSGYEKHFMPTTSEVYVLWFKTNVGWFFLCAENAHCCSLFLQVLKG